jgi:hypothetical protein
MRQRALVIIKPNQIPRIDPAVAYFASEKVIGLGNATPVGALAEHRPARSRFIEWHDRCHLAHLTKKNQAPELLPRPDPHGAGYIRPLPLNLWYRKHRRCQIAAFT